MTSPEETKYAQEAKPLLSGQASLARIQLFCSAAALVGVLVTTTMWSSKSQALSRAHSAPPVSPDAFIGGFIPGQTARNVSEQEFVAIELKGKMNDLENAKAEALQATNALKASLQQIVAEAQESGSTAPTAEAAPPTISPTVQKLFDEALAQLQKEDPAQSSNNIIEQATDWTDDMKRSYIDALQRTPIVDDKERRSRVAKSFFLIEAWDLWKDDEVRQRVTSFSKENPSLITLFQLMPLVQYTGDPEFTADLKASYTFKHTRRGKDDIRAWSEDATKSLASLSMRALDVDSPGIASAATENSALGDIAREMIMISRRWPESTIPKIGEYLQSEDSVERWIAGQLVRPPVPAHVRDQLLPYMVKHVLQNPTDDALANTNSARMMHDLVSGQTVDAFAKGVLRTRDTNPQIASLIAAICICKAPSTTLEELAPIFASTTADFPLPRIDRSTLLNGSDNKQHPDLNTAVNYLESLNDCVDWRLASALIGNPKLVERDGVINCLRFFGKEWTASAMLAIHRSKTTEPSAELETAANAIRSRLTIPIN